MDKLEMVKLRAEHKKHKRYVKDINRALRMIETDKQYVKIKVSKLYLFLKTKTNVLNTGISVINLNKPITEEYHAQIKTFYNSIIEFRAHMLMVLSSKDGKILNLDVADTVEENNGEITT